MILSKFFLIAGSLVMGVLGTVHMILTFFTDNFLPRERKLAQEMDKISPVLTDQTSMWKAWIGFNASHSSGIMFLAIINCFLAIKYFPLLHKSNFFFIVNIVAIAFYIFLAKKYWFTSPLIGLGIVLFCYLTSYILALTGK